MMFLFPSHKSWLKMKLKRVLYCTVLICFLIGTAGILISSHNTTNTYSQLTFIISSLLLGLSPLIFIFSPASQNKNENFIIASLLFLVAIIKVLGLHIKYGLYLGCDSVAEFSVIKSLFLQPTFELTSNALTEFPLSYIAVYIISAITNVSPIAGSWNLIHLVSHALTVIFLYLLIEDIFDRDIAIISCIAYMYNPAVSIYSLSMTRENYGILFLVASIYIMQIQAKKNGPSGTLIYIIISIALIFSHYTTSYFSLLTLSLLFLTGFILHVSKMENQDSKKYRDYYVLFFSLVLFLWVFYLTFHHQGDIRIADHMLRGIADLFKTKEMEVSSSSETTKILSDFSVVQTLYKLQALYMAIGSFYLLARIRKLSGYQRIFAVVAFVNVCLISLSAVVPSLANSLSPTRIMRFGIVLACVPIGYITVQMKSKVEPDKQKMNKIIVLMVIALFFVYPISQWIATEYMAFRPEPYPSELRSEMYNIRSTHEINTLDRIGRNLPENSTLALEMQLATARIFSLYEPRNSHSILLDDTVLFGKESDNYTSNTFIFMRKSLYEERQFVEYPENWRSALSFLKTLNDTEFVNLNEKIEDNYLVYDEGAYKLLKLK